jgi:hypothetical protein
MENKKLITDKPQNKGQLGKDDVPPDSPMGINLMCWKENPKRPGKENSNILSVPKDLYSGSSI